MSDEASKDLGVETEEQRKKRLDKAVGLALYDKETKDPSIKYMRNRTYPGIGKVE